jgi:TolB protein
MKKNFLILFLILLIPIKAFALIEVDITRGNLNPLPLAVSPLSIMINLKKVLKKFLKEKILGLKFQVLLKII